jgi:hypothetical protein
MPSTPGAFLPFWRWKLARSPSGSNSSPNRALNRSCGSARAQRHMTHETTSRVALQRFRLRHRTCGQRVHPGSVQWRGGRRACWPACAPASSKGARPARAERNLPEIQTPQHQKQTRSPTPVASPFQASVSIAHRSASPTGFGAPAEEPIRVGPDVVLARTRQFTTSYRAQDYQTQ